MISLNEQLIPLRLVPSLKCIPPRRQGKPLNVATVFRWVQTGVRGIKLETVRVGATRCTSESALLAFFRRLDSDSNPESNGHHAGNRRATKRKRHD